MCGNNVSIFLIRVAKSNHQSELCVQVRKAAGLQEDAFCYTALLKAASKEKKSGLMDSMFDQAWDSGVRDSSLFNVLISHQNKQRHFKVNLPNFSSLCTSAEACFNIYAIFCSYFGSFLCQALQITHYLDVLLL